MPRRARRVLLITLGLLLSAFAALNGLAYRHARAMLGFQDGGQRTSAPEGLSALARVRVLLLGLDIPRPMSGRAPSTLHPSCRDLSIAALDGPTLAAWYCGAEIQTPLVVLFHGYAAEKSSLMAEARLLRELGASVLLVDFRGSGGSSESYTTLGALEAEDVKAAVDYARGALAHPALILYGQSMGAAAILRAVQTQGVTADGLILEAIFDTLLNAVRNRFRAMGVPSYPSAELLVFWGSRQSGFDGFALNPVADAASLSTPVLFLHGAEDRRATLAQARRVYAAVPGPKTFRVFEGTGHTSLAAQRPAEWKDAVEGLLRVAEGAVRLPDASSRAGGRGHAGGRGQAGRSCLLPHPAGLRLGTRQHRVIAYRPRAARARPLPG